MQGGKMQTSEVVSHLNDALGSMLSQKNGISLDQRLVAASKKILLQKIEFEPARRTSSLFPLQSLRAKYTPLNAASTGTESGGCYCYKLFLDHYLYADAPYADRYHLSAYGHR